MNWGLYIGQKVKFCGNIHTITEVGRGHLHLSDRQNLRVMPEDATLILRSLDQMTSEERIEYSLIVKNRVIAIGLDNNSFDAKPGEICKDYIYVGVDAIDWLTSKGFAIRGEIESGTAIKEAK